MNVNLKTPTMGHAAGVYAVTSVTPGTYTLKGHKGELFEVPASSVEFAAETDTPAPTLLGPEEAPPARYEVDEYTEAVARSMYDDYSSAAGGTAFNGDPLPPASEFFEDARKQKQANAWRVTAIHAIDRITEDALRTIEEATDDPAPTSSSDPGEEVV